jgi:RNA polymerase sigma-70 factor (ECF subfamily)
MTAFSEFEDHVRTHKDQVYGFACAMLRDDVVAQDVTQDVFITLWEHRDEVDPDRALPWLMRVTRNACIDQLRRRQTRQRTMTVDTDSLSRAECRRPQPDTATEASDFDARLHDALDEIDEPYRSVVLLREVQELKYKEIAETLDMPLNTVKVYIHRGRKKLRRHLSERLDYVSA